MLARVGPVAYQLALPVNIKIHKVIHVSLLKKYVHDPSHVINWHVVQVEPEGEFLAKPLCILDLRVVTLCNRDLVQLKVQWKRFTREEGTWELEDAFKEFYPSMF